MNDVDEARIDWSEGMDEDYDVFEYLVDNDPLRLRDIARGMALTLMAIRAADPDDLVYMYQPMAEWDLMKVEL